MPRAVNVWTSEWAATGTKVLCPRYTFKVRAEWRANTGAAKQDTRVVTFPDDLIALAQAGGADREWLEGELKELLFKVARRLAKVDDE